MKQKILNPTQLWCELHNFLRVPESSGSLQRHLDEGWTVKFMSVTQDESRGTFLMEKSEGEAGVQTRAEPSRLEIAAMVMQGLVTAHFTVGIEDDAVEASPQDFATIALEFADALIAQSKEEN